MLRDIYGPKTLQYSGVFLIDEPELLVLDKILAELFSEISKVRKRQISQQCLRLSKRYPDRYKNDSEGRAKVAEEFEFREEAKFIELRVHGRMERFTSIEEAGHSDKFDGAVPTRLEYYLVAGRNCIEVILNCDTFSNALTVHIAPHDLLDGRALMPLRRWAEQQRQPPFVNWWASHLGELLLGIWGIFVLTYIVVPALFTRLHVSPIATEVRALLANGVNSANRDKALETLLRLNSWHLEPYVGGIDRDRLFDVSFVAAILLTVIVFCHPSTAIGIGRGKLWICIQKKWMWFVKSFVFGTLILGTLVAAVRKAILG